MSNYRLKVDQPFRDVKGSFLDQGAQRSVYVHNTDPSMVVKIARKELGGGEWGAKTFRNGVFCNVTEWNLWQAAEDWGFGPYLAPCCALSPSGIYLIQKRVEPLDVLDPKHLEILRCPERGSLPLNVVGDLLEFNLGIYDNRIVILDYGWLHLRTLIQAANPVHLAEHWEWVKRAVAA